MMGRPHLANTQMESSSDNSRGFFENEVESDNILNHLLLAVRLGKLDLLKQLFATHQQLKYLDIDSFKGKLSPLHWCAYYGKHPEIIKFLLHNTDLMLHDQWGHSDRSRSVMHYAVNHVDGIDNSIIIESMLIWAETSPFDIRNYNILLPISQSFKYKKIIDEVRTDIFGGIIETIPDMLSAGVSSGTPMTSDHLLADYLSIPHAQRLSNVEVQHAQVIKQLALTYKEQAIMSNLNDYLRRILENVTAHVVDVNTRGHIHSTREQLYKIVNKYISKLGKYHELQLGLKNEITKHMKMLYQLDQQIEMQQYIILQLVSASLNSDLNRKQIEEAMVDQYDPVLKSANNTLQILQKSKDEINRIENEIKESTPFRDRLNAEFKFCVASLKTLKPTLIEKLAVSEIDDLNKVEEVIGHNHAEVGKPPQQLIIVPSLKVPTVQITPSDLKAQEYKLAKAINVAVVAGRLDVIVQLSRAHQSGGYFNFSNINIDSFAKDFSPLHWCAYNGKYPEVVSYLVCNTALTLHDLWGSDESHNNKTQGSARKRTVIECALDHVISSNQNRKFKQLDNSSMLKRILMHVSPCDSRSGYIFQLISKHKKYSSIINQVGYSEVEKRRIQDILLQPLEKSVVIIKDDVRQAKTELSSSSVAPPRQTAEQGMEAKLMAIRQQEIARESLSQSQSIIPTAQAEQGKCDIKYECSADKSQIDEIHQTYKSMREVKINSKTMNQSEDDFRIVIEQLRLTERKYAEQRDAALQNQYAIAQQRTAELEKQCELSKLREAEMLKQCQLMSERAHEREKFYNFKIATHMSDKELEIDQKIQRSKSLLIDIEIKIANSHQREKKLIAEYESAERNAREAERHRIAGVIDERKLIVDYLKKHDGGINLNMPILAVSEAGSITQPRFDNSLSTIDSNSTGRDHLPLIGRVGSLGSLESLESVENLENLETLESVARLAVAMSLEITEANIASLESMSVAQAQPPIRPVLVDNFVERPARVPQRLWVGKEKVTLTTCNKSHRLIGAANLFQPAPTKSSARDRKHRQPKHRR